MSDSERFQSKKEDLLSNDYASECPACGAVVFDWEDRCTECKGTGAVQETLPDGGTSEGESDQFVCWSCDGVGSKEGLRGDRTVCQACNGDGLLSEERIRQMWRSWKYDEIPDGVSI